MHTVARYSNSDMKLNTTTTTETYNGGEKYDNGAENEYNSLNHRGSTDSIPLKGPDEQVSVKEKLVNNCVTETPKELTNGKSCDENFSEKSSDNANNMEIKPTDTHSNGDSKSNNAMEHSNNNIDLTKTGLIDKDQHSLIDDFGGGKSETKTARIERQLNKIEQLKDSLICEEAKLTIVRKLIDSQRRKDTHPQSKGKHPPASLNVPNKQSVQSAPKSAQQMKQQMPPGKPGPKPGDPPGQKYYVQVGNQLVPASAPPSTHTSSTSYQYVNGGSNNSYQPPQPPPKPQPPKQTPEQKQNAAKAALRRQLEQTLLQIPPPRPPPADWKAIPNVNSIDFMMLVGLDEVVDNILDFDSKPTLKKALEELVPYNPRVCSQCSVDFSPCWKNKDKANKAIVLCERCALQNVKKDLKAEHTARLKSAFLKALKQEQEIEEKIKAGEDVNISGISPTTEKTENSRSPSNQPSVRISSPKSVAAAPSRGSNQNDTQQKASPGHHGRPVIQHYPQHSPLVQQLHQQHLRTDESSSQPQRHSTSSSNNRWHPYRTPSSSQHGHSRDHHQTSHRTSTASSDGPPKHQEYYVVHHPQRGGRGRYIKR
jgi:hypothetical protein